MPEDAPGLQGPVGTRREFFHRLGLLWGSQMLSAMGDQFYLLAMIWTATTLAGSRAGLVLFVQYGATLGVNVVFGGLPDRRDRRVLMVGADVFRAVVVFLLPLWAAGAPLQFWQLLGAAALLGALGAVFDPALQATLPTLAVTPRRLHAANTLMEFTRRLARVLAPSAAALLLARMSMTALFTLDGVSFVISALAIAGLWGSLRPPAAPVGGWPRSSGVRASLAGSWRLAFRAPRVSWGLATMLVGNVVWSIGFVVGTPLWVQRVLGGGSGAYAVLTATFGAGNVVGLLTVGFLPRLHRLRAMCGGSLLMGLGYLILAASSHEAVGMLGLFIAGVGGPFHSLSLVGMLQNELPREELGRAYGLYMIAGGLGVAGGSLGAAALFGALSVAPALAMGAVVMLLWTVMVLVRAEGIRNQLAPLS